MTPLSPIQSSIIDAIDIPAGGLALLAFVMALYVLAAREQKTPYITNSVYFTAFVVLVAILFSTIGKVLTVNYPTPASIFKILGLLIFALGILNVLFRVWHVRNRKLYFRDDRLLTSIKFVRILKRAWRSVRRQPSYEHNPMGLTEGLLKSIMACKSMPVSQLRAAVDRNKNVDGVELSLSAACRVPTLLRADEIMVELAICFLEHQCWVQYTSCTRHPVEFILNLKKAWQAKFKDRDWKTVANQIIAADVYTPHFGFTDSIHDELTDRLKKNLLVECITAKASYAGLHSAAARAFNRIRARAKKQGDSRYRLPTLVIYDGPHALVELESLEQYRIFIRHLIPSERLWGGMFTLVVESVIRDEDVALLQSYADVFIDLSAKNDIRNTDAQPLHGQKLV